MPSIRCIFLSFSLLCLCGSSAIPRKVTAAEPYAISIVEPALSNHAIRPGAPLPETCRPGSLIEMVAARGEYEPASFVLETAQPLSGVRVRASELRSATGTISANAIDLRVVAPVLRYTSDFPIVMNWILVHDPNLIEVRNEPQPRSQKADASPVDRAHVKTNYFTRAPIDADELQPADVSKRQQFWLTVHVPDDAPAGSYRGKLTVSASQQQDREIDLVLTVPSFDLADPEFEYSVYHPA